MHTPSIPQEILESVSMLSLEVSSLNEKALHAQQIRKAQGASLLNLLIERVKPSLGLLVKRHPGIDYRIVQVAPISNRHGVRRVFGEGCISEGLYLTDRSAFCEITNPVSATYAEPRPFCSHISTAQVVEHYDIPAMATELIRLLEQKKSEIYEEIAHAPRAEFRLVECST